MPTPAPDDAPLPNGPAPDASMDATDAMQAGGVPEMTPDELAARRRSPTPPVVVDVREPWEHEIAHIEGARLVPLRSLPAALSTFDPGAEYVLYCHHGVRSLAGAEFLRERGLTRVANLTGGIDAWSVRVDPAVPRY